MGDELIARLEGLRQLAFLHRYALHLGPRRDRHRLLRGRAVVEREGQVGRSRHARLKLIADGARQVQH